MLNRYTLVGYAAPATLARCGDAAAAPAVLLMMLLADQPAGRAALVVAMLAGSSALSAPFVGMVLDTTRHPRRVFVAALASLAAGLVVLAQPGMPTPALVLVAAIAGLSGPALTGGWTAQLGSWVPQPSLRKAHAVDVLTYNVAGVAGPGLAAAVAATLGGPSAVYCAAGTVAVALVWVGLRPGWPPSPRRELVAGSRLGALRQGLALPLRQPDLARVAVATTVGHFGLAFVVVSTPLLGERLTGNVSFGGALLSAFALGGIVGALVAGHRRFRYEGVAPVLVGTALVGACFAVLPLLTSPWPVLGVMVLAGMIDGPVLTATFGVRQAASPPELRAQIFTTAASVKMGAYACGAVVAGRLAEQSVTLTIAAGAALHVVAAAAAIAAGSVVASRRRPDVRLQACQQCVPVTSTSPQCTGPPTR